ncbi:uncharacterized protein TNCV_3621481 [Trichonephila clavipes]|nr:uncharacterized protein TNCV_3621481 [Trichonephila clavipes]
MSHSKPFQTVEEALEYVCTLSDNEERLIFVSCSQKKVGVMTRKILMKILFSQLPADVCGKIEISTNIDNDEISHEDMFDREGLSPTKGMSNLKRKLKSNETNIELRRRK